MAFQTPVTIKYALDKIYRRDYVLPAIQREFVWKPSQICRLFDSLMQGYPIGSFLFWKVSRQNRERFTFYDFVREYQLHCPSGGSDRRTRPAAFDCPQHRSERHRPARDRTARRETTQISSKKFCLAEEFARAGRYECFRSRRRP